MELSNLLNLVVSYSNGESITAMAARTGFPTSRVRRLLKGTGLKLRTHSEARGLASNRLVRDKIGNLSQLAAEHVAGASIGTIATRIGIKPETLERRLRVAGHKVLTGEAPRWQTNLPTREIVDRYIAGESVLSLSKAYGVSRAAIAARLASENVRLRGVESSNSSRSGGRDRAATRQAKMLAVTPTEKLLAEAFAAAGLKFEQQTPCDTYNLDFTIDGFPVAVEVEGGPAFRYPHCILLWERTKYVLDKGWSVLYVATDYKPVDFGRVVEQTVAFAELTRSNPSSRGRYGVVRRNGKPSDLSRHNLEALPRVEGF